MHADTFANAAATVARLTVPGPSPMPILGAFGNMAQFGLDPLGRAARLFAQYGPLVSLVRAPARAITPFGVCVLLATGPELNRTILTDGDTFYMYALTGRFMVEGEAKSPRHAPLRRAMTGLFHVNGDKHRRQRRLMMPAFHRSRIDAYRNDMVQLVDEMLASWRPGQARNLSHDMTELTLRITTKTLFGADEGERGTQIANWLQEWGGILVSLKLAFPFDLPGTPFRRWLDLGAKIDHALVEVLRDKRARGADGADVLSMLLQAKDEDGSTMTEDDLVGHAGVIFAAGHDTSANAITWTLLLLSQHPTIANELVEELRGKLHGQPPTVAQLADLPLLDAVVKESMRILPPVPHRPRYAAHDTELAGHFIPKHTEILLSIYHIHHDPAIFPEPERFKPSRWQTIKPTPFEYNPFSAGPRICIGAQFAIMEVKIALAMILQRFRITPDRRRRIDRRVAVSMAPKNGLQAMIHPADGRWASSTGGLRGNIREMVELPR
jgi:cytochrome P450